MCIVVNDYCVVWVLVKQIVKYCNCLKQCIFLVLCTTYVTIKRASSNIVNQSLIPNLTHKQ